MVTFDDVAPGASNVAQLSLQGSGTPVYQVAASYYLPWSRVAPGLSEEQPVSISVSYDRSTLRVNDTIGVQVRVTLNETGTAQQALIDLGVPPGFEVLADSLQARIARAAICLQRMDRRASSDMNSPAGNCWCTFAT